jgi:VanZ family protein
LIFKKLLVLYLVGLFLAALVPLTGFPVSLDKVTVICFQLDHLLHGLIFVPLVLLWCRAYPHHPVWLVLAACMVLAAGMEGIHYLLPYRTYNVNDALSNGIGVVVGGVLLGGWKVCFGGQPLNSQPAGKTPLCGEKFLFRDL